MRFRVLTVMENTWAELFKRRAVVILVAAVALGYATPMMIQHYFNDAFHSGAKLADLNQAAAITSIRMMLLAGFIVSIIFAAGLVELETSKRTLLAVMVRPIAFWEYLLGRTLGVLSFYMLFCMVASLCGLITSLILGFSYPSEILWGVIQRFGAGFSWIFLAAALGAVVSSANVLISLVTLPLLAYLVGQLDADVHWAVATLQNSLHYLLPASRTVDFLDTKTWSSVTTEEIQMNGAILLQNITYGIAAFLGAVGLYGLRDVKLRED